MCTVTTYHTGTLPIIPNSYAGTGAGLCPTDYGCNVSCYLPPASVTPLVNYFGWLALKQFQPEDGSSCRYVPPPCDRGCKEQYQALDCNPPTPTCDIIPVYPSPPCGPCGTTNIGRRTKTTTTKTAAPASCKTCRG
jgi:hypothetical protein